MYLFYIVLFASDARGFLFSRIIATGFVYYIDLYGCVKLHTKYTFKQCLIHFGYFLH